MNFLIESTASLEISKKLTFSKFYLNKVYVKLTRKNEKERETVLSSSKNVLKFHF